MRASMAATSATTNNTVTTAYTYDPLNRLSTVNEANTGTTQYNYDPAGNLQSFTEPNGIVHKYTYDAENRLTNLAVAPPSPAAAIASYAYTLDAAGHRKSVTELSGRTVNYGYDNIYRLTSETIASDTNGINGAISYAYDDVGNRLSQTSSVAGIPSASPTYDSDDRISTDTYDANGNTLTTAGNSNTNVYDFENHLVQQGTIGVVYDGDGSRVEKDVNGVVTKYLVDDGVDPTGYSQVLIEDNTANGETQYVYGLERISERWQGSVSSSTFTNSFYGYDGHGSVRFLTDQTGAVTDTYDYDAFGNLLHVTGTTPNVYRFAGEQFDPDLNLYYNRARYLNTAEGRFITMDTVEGNGQDPASLHKYLYADADPTNGIDPSGNQFDIAGEIEDVAIDTTLNTIPSAVLNSPLGRSVTGFVASLFIPPDVWAGLQNLTPDAIEVGAFGQVTLDTRFPVGLTGFGGLEFLWSPKTDKAALYGYLGTGVALGNAALAGGGGGNLGLVFNSPSSEDYTNNFINVTVPVDVLPAKVRQQIFADVALSSWTGLAGSASSYSQLTAIISQVTTVTPSRWGGAITIFSSPSKSPAFGVSFGLNTSRAALGGTGTSNVSVTWSYYWQLWPGSHVLFR